MNYKKILKVVTTSLVISVLFFVFYKNNEKENNVRTGMNDDWILSRCNVIQDQNIRSKCYLYIAKSYGKSDLCNHIEDEITKEDCYYFIAQKNQDIELCANVIFQIDKSTNCYSEIAIKLNKEVLCFLSEVDEVKNNCFLKVVMKKNILKQDLVMCEMKDISSNLRDECYFAVANASIDSLVCSKIDNQNRKKECIDSVETLKSYAGR